MSNTLTSIMPQILARGLIVLREQCVMPRLVNTDYSSEAKEKGDTIDVPIPTAVTTVNVTPSNTLISPSDTVTSKVQITLDKWRQSSPFHLTDKELVNIDRNKHFLPMQAGEAVRALANYVNEQILATYTGIYGYVGTAGTTPFGSGVTDATDARKVLNQQVAPRDMRRGVLDYDAEANALALSPFADAEKTLSANVKINGEIGRKYGIDWVADDAVPTHTAGTSSGTLVNQADHAIGDKTVACDTGTGTLVVGDIFTVAGDSQTYVVTTAVADVSSGSIAYLPAAKTAFANNAAITVKASHAVNLAFHRDAFAFATRPLVSETLDVSLGSQIMSMQDPKTGLVLRLEVSRQHKQVVWEFDILFGVKLVRAALACRIAG